MKNLRRPDWGGPITAEGLAQIEGHEPPNPIGQRFERPTRLEDGELFEAVSVAVARELEGGMPFNLSGVITLGLILMGYKP